MLKLIDTNKGTEWGLSVYYPEGDPNHKVVVLPLVDWEGLIETCRDIVDYWESGDLAAAVHNLQGWLEGDEPEEDETPDEWSSFLTADS